MCICSVLSFVYLLYLCSALVWLVVRPHQGRFRQELGTGFKPSQAPVVRWHDDDNDQGQARDEDDEGNDEDEERASMLV